MNFKALAKIFFVNIKKLLMADLLSNGLHEKVLICYIIMFQPAFTCSKLTTEALEQGVKYVQVNNKDTRATEMASLWCLYC